MKFLICAFVCLWIYLFIYYLFIYLFLYLYVVNFFFTYLVIYFSVYYLLICGLVQLCSHLFTAYPLNSPPVYVLVHLYVALFYYLLFSLLMYVSVYSFLCWFIIYLFMYLFNLCLLQRIFFPFPIHSQPNRWLLRPVRNSVLIPKKGEVQALPLCPASLCCTAQSELYNSHEPRILPKIGMEFCSLSEFLI
jgi:hypothetical protein